MTGQKIYHVCVECTPYHIDNCATCFGYGLKKGTQIPVAAGDVKTLMECAPCPECGGDLKNEHLYKLEKEDRELSLARLRSIRYQTESSPGSPVNERKFSELKPGENFVIKGKKTPHGFINIKDGLTIYEIDPETLVEAIALHVEKNSTVTTKDNGDGTFTHTYTFKSD